MIKKVKELIVVEGKTDIDFLSSFLDADFYQVHGSAVSTADLVFLDKANAKRGIIILTDPDFPGKQIRSKILLKIPNAKQAFVRKEVSIKHHKVGVAESTKEEVLAALDNVVSYSNNKGVLNINNLFALSLVGQKNSAELRRRVCNSLMIGYSNGKELLLKLNSISISIKELEEIVKNVK